MQGEPKYAPSQELPDFSYADYARMLGLEGERVDDPEELGPAWDRALAAGRPFVLEVVADANIPPFPPHIVDAQAEKYREAQQKSDPEAADIERGMRQQGSGASR